EIYDDDVWVTQCGSVKGNSPFNAQPRWYAEVELSIVEGRLSLGEAVRRAFRRPAEPEDRVRYFRARDLRINGYRAYSRPTRANPLHGCIRAPIDDDDKE